MSTSDWRKQRKTKKKITIYQYLMYCNQLRYNECDCFFSFFFLFSGLSFFNVLDLCFIGVLALYKPISNS